MKDDSKKISFRRIALYSVSGVSATGVEWLFFYLLNGVLGLHYEASTFIAMSISGLVGWAVGRALLFKSTGHPIREIAMIYATGFIGILFNMLLMWIFVDIFSVKEMVSKAISSIIVFLWNYLTRELFIYR
jgi:putative flippase GtrA